MLITSLRPGKSAPFFSLALNSAYGNYYFRNEAWGTAQSNISVPILKEMPIAAPPDAEQAAIASYLTERSRLIDILVDKARKAVGLLKERRSALITVAVAGQINVSTYGSDEKSAVVAV